MPVFIWLMEGSGLVFSIAPIQNLVGVLVKQQYQPPLGAVSLSLFLSLIIYFQPLCVLMNNLHKQKMFELSSYISFVCHYI